MSNACQNFLVIEAQDPPLCHSTSSADSPCSGSSALQRKTYHDALAAKQRALRLLKSVLSSIDSVNLDVVLAVVLLFVQFELIDSGRDKWRYHINGARTIIETLLESGLSTQVAMSPLRSCLVSNCLVFVTPFCLQVSTCKTPSANLYQIRHSRFNARKFKKPCDRRYLSHQCPLSTTRRRRKSLLLVPGNSPPIDPNRFSNVPTQ